MCVSYFAAKINAITSIAKSKKSGKLLPFSVPRGEEESTLQSGGPALALGILGGRKFEISKSSFSLKASLLRELH